MSQTPQSTIDTVREMYLAGATYSDIGDVIGGSRNRVAGLVARHCQDLRASETVGRSEESIESRIERIRAALDVDPTINGIVKIVGMHRQTVSKIIANHLVDLHRQKMRARDNERAAARAAARPKPVVAAVGKTEPRPLTVPIALVVSNPIPFTSARGCRYPLWAEDADLSEKTVCGAGCEPGRSFYASHHRMAYRTVQRRAA